MQTALEYLRGAGVLPRHMYLDLTTRYRLQDHRCQGCGLHVAITELDVALTSRLYFPQLQLVGAGAIAGAFAVAAGGAFAEAFAGAFAVAFTFSRPKTSALAKLTEGIAKK